MPVPVAFENFAPFDEPVSDAANVDCEAGMEAARREGYAAGLDAGMEAAAQAHAETQDQLRASLVETLQDQAQSRQEMQAAILRGVAPLIDSVIGRLSPRLALAGLAEMVTREVATALATRPDPTPEIRCAEETLAPLRAALADRALRVVFTVDPAFTPLEAEVHWDDGFDAIDLRPVAARIDAAMERFLSATPPNDFEHERKERDAG